VQRVWLYGFTAEMLKGAWLKEGNKKTSSPLGLKLEVILKLWKSWVI